MTIPFHTAVANSDGMGFATTTIKDVSLGELFDSDEERFILVHARAEMGQGVPLTSRALTWSAPLDPGTWGVPTSQ